MGTDLQEKPTSKSLTPQLIATIGLLAVGIIVIVTSFQLGVGTVRQPGAGFTGLITGSALVGLSALIIAGLVRQALNAPLLPNSAQLGVFLNQILVLSAMGAYIYFMPLIGYLVSTFLFASVTIFLVFWRGWTIPFYGAAIALAAYVIFYKLLSVPLPL